MNKSNEDQSQPTNDVMYIEGGWTYQSIPLTILDSDIGPLAKDFMNHLHSNAEGFLPNQTEIAHNLFTTVNTLKKAISLLESRGMLRVEHRLDKYGSQSKAFFLINDPNKWVGMTYRNNRTAKRFIKRPIEKEVSQGAGVSNIDRGGYQELIGGVSGIDSPSIKKEIKKEVKKEPSLPKLKSTSKAPKKIRKLTEELPWRQSDLKLEATMPAHTKDFGSEKRKPRHKAEKYPIDDLDKLKFRADLDLMIKNGDKLINGKEARTVLLSKIWDTTQAKINPERLLNGIYSMISQPAKVATGGKLECSQLVADFPIILKEARKAISS